MTMEQRLKAVLGELQFAVVALQVELEEAKKKIAELSALEEVEK